MKLECAAKTEQGDRGSNEDFYIDLIKKDWALFAVADGLGGHSAGELASRYFCEELAENIADRIADLQSSPADGMKKLITIATKNMAKKLNKKHLSDARTTAAIAWLNKEKIVIAHVGDSRVYFFNDEKKIWRTRDHSLVQQFVDAGILDESEMGHHPQQNIILQAIGVAETPKPDVEIFPALKKDELLVLCTDGFWEQITPAEMLALINAPKLDSALENLVQQAVQRASPHSDNVTVIAARSL